MIFLLTGCATVTRHDGAAPEAARRIAAVSDLNEGLKSLKGLGGLDVQRSGKRYRLRMAWVCRPPDQFRVTVLGGLGRPALTFTADGRQFSYLSHDDGEFKQWPADAALVPVQLPMAVAPADIATILSGRVPIRPHDAAAVHRGADGGRVVTLKRWHRRIQTIAFPDATDIPEAFAVYNEHGERAYRVGLSDYRREGDYLLPGAIGIEGPDGSRVTITADRYWPDASVDPAVFTLSPPP